MEDYIHYDDLIDSAMRKVVQAALLKVEKEGFPGNHHFLISFLTDYEGVTIPLSLKEKYPEEMTIVLQHQFEELQVSDDGFEVMLRFNNVKEHIIVPYNAITSFADPSVRFGLKFNFVEDKKLIAELDSLLESISDDADEIPQEKPKDQSKTKAQKKKTAKKKENIISLDFGGKGKGPKKK